MDTREKLAEYAHSSWSGWMKHMWKCSKKVDGCLVVPANLVALWERQMTTSYKQLPESEKQSDLVEADRILKIVREESE